LAGIVACIGKTLSKFEAAGSGGHQERWSRLTHGDRGVGREGEYRSVRSAHTNYKVVVSLEELSALMASTELSMKLPLVERNAEV
jgi:hypothetical protein